MNIRIFTFVACLSTLAFSASATPIDLAPTDDTYTSDRDGGGPNGGSSELRSKNESSDNRRISFLQFDLTGITEVNDATFELTPVDTGLGDNPNGTATFEVLGSIDKVWDELTLVVGSGTNGDESLLNNSTSLGTFNMTDQGTTTPGTVNFSNSALTTFLDNNAGGNVTLIVQRTAWNGGSYVHAFSSKEGLSSPNLSVTPVPEPSAAILAILGLIGLFAIRRRGR